MHVSLLLSENLTIRFVGCFIGYRCLVAAANFSLFRFYCLLLVNKVSLFIYAFVLKHLFGNYLFYSSWYILKCSGFELLCLFYGHFESKAFSVNFGKKLKNLSPRQMQNCLFAMQIEKHV